MVSFVLLLFVKREPCVERRRQRQQETAEEMLNPMNKTRQITRQEMWGEGEVTWPVKKLLVPLYTGCGSGSAPQGAKQRLHVQVPLRA